MEVIRFKLKGAYIELIQLLKVVSIAQTGGHAKILVDDGVVQRKGEPEYRKRAKIRVGDEVIVNQEIKIVIESEE